MRTAKLIAILLLVHSSVARADQEQEAAKRAARARFVDGDLAFKDGKYDKAIEEFKASYKLYPAPKLLYNIAQAYRLNGDSSTALNYYRDYLEKQPKGELADKAR